MRIPSAEEPAVFGVAAYPKPQHPVRQIHTYSAMAQADPSRPETTDLLEMQRWMSGGFAEQGKGLISEFLDAPREGAIAGPKIRGGVVVHSFVERPAR